MTNQSGGPCVVVVEDDPQIQCLLQDTLEEAGFQVILSATYAEAISLIEARNDEVFGLVTDINLGDHRSGWDVARDARKLVPSLPVVYMTGDSAHEWPALGVPHSVVVTKPFAPAQITVALAGLANKSDPQAEPDRVRQDGQLDHDGKGALWLIGPNVIVLERS